MLDYLMDNKKTLLVGAAMGVVAAYLYHRRQQSAVIRPIRGVEIHRIDAVTPPSVFLPEPGSSDSVVIWIQEPAAQPKAADKK